MALFMNTTYNMNMSKHTFEMTWDQVDAVVIKELQGAYERECYPGRDEGGQDVEPDFHLLNSIETVLAYFMPKSEYRAWLKASRPGYERTGAVGNDTVTPTPPGANGGTGPSTTAFDDQFRDDWANHD